MARTDPAINLRIPADLKERVEKAAREAGRSTNAEIVRRLSEAIASGPEVSATAERFAALKVAEEAERTTYWALVAASAAAKENPSEATERALEEAERARTEAIVRAQRAAREVANLLIDICYVHGRVGDILFPDGVPER